MSSNRAPSRDISRMATPRTNEDKTRFMICRPRHHSQFAASQNRLGLAGERVLQLRLLPLRQVALVNSLSVQGDHHTLRRQLATRSTCG